MDTAHTGPNPDRLRKPVTGRLMKLPVPVSVHLAERKIELSQLLSLAPGTLLTFEKSCEDLLDLYVNNQIYARGEAVKIGEKFGLKINELSDESGERRASAP
jgi:flagellar motor switch protein FliN/FliY